VRFEVINQYQGVLLSGFWLTIQIAVGATILGLALGLIAAICRMGPIAPLRWIAGVYIEVIRNTPALVQVFVIYYGLGEFGIQLRAFPALILALGINNGAYLAEVFRGGLQSVKRGQLEAAAALALPRRTTFLGVVLPQAIRAIWPALTNQTIQIVLATSLGTIIGLPELVNQTMFIDSRTFRTIELLTAVTLMYWGLTLAVTFVSRLIANRLERAYR